MKYLHVLVMFVCSYAAPSIADVIFDPSRERYIPVDVSHPDTRDTCTSQRKCPVAFISAGYGVSHSQYTFLTDALNKHGYLTVAIAHELPGDPPLSTQGNLFQTRSENWRRGAKTVDFLQRYLGPQYAEYDFNSLVLIGHSNGGDISAWLANERQPYVTTVITLDSRRVPLPRQNKIKVFSLRGSDFPADEGVLPTEEERLIYNMCVVKIPDSKHNDMSDFGPDWLTEKLSSMVIDYLAGEACASLQQSA